MMGSKCFDTQEARDRLEGSRKVERLSHFTDGNNRRYFPDGRNEKSWKNKRCEEENPCQSVEDALAWDRQLCLSQ